MVIDLMSYPSVSAIPIADRIQFLLERDLDRDYIRNSSQEQFARDIFHELGFLALIEPGEEDAIRQYIKEHCEELWKVGIQEKKDN